MDGIGVRRESRAERGRGRAAARVAQMDGARTVTGDLRVRFPRCTVAASGGTSTVHSTGHFDEVGTELR